MSCDECKADLPERKARYCKECLKRLCKGCLKGGMLCKEHFDSLPESARGSLEKDARKERSGNVIALIGFAIALPSLVSFAVWGLINRLTADKSTVPILLMLAWGLLIGSLLFILPYSQNDKRAYNRYAFLKQQGIRVQFKVSEGATYTCQVCGAAAPPRKAGKDTPYKCKVCSKTLCLNCYFKPGLCPAHDKEIPHATREQLRRLEERQERIERWMIAWVIIIPVYTIIVVPTENMALLSLIPVIAFGFLIAFLVLPVWMGRTEDKILQKIKNDYCK
jgi:hypothetical protein